ncbi:MAG: helix-turn-helix domain-containing protein, partial [Gloeomargarita sp. SKYB31]|nr:helix-turn-helix domain-containing protein [Gloeomargarita sp. SKYB31]
MNRLAHTQLARQRLRLCHAREAGRSFGEIARAYGVSKSTAWKWSRRWHEGGRQFEALYNRPNTPRRTRARTDIDGAVRELWERGLRGKRLQR